MHTSRIVHLIDLIYLIQNDPNIDPRIALIMRCIGILFQAALFGFEMAQQLLAAHRSSAAWAKATSGELSLPLGPGISQHK